ncbi:CaiB/BaiF CoA transferase family protein [Rhodococcus koreensis]
MTGPLEGVRVVEVAGAGPGPFAAMLLADLGAEVIRVERPPNSGGEIGLERPLELSLDLRSRNIVRLDLKAAGGRELFLDLVEQADIMIEVFRPRVAERLGIGPDDCFARNPRLVYGRMTGWGQQGPMANLAGHDLNYIGLTGVLDAVGRVGSAPTPPLNLVGDYGGGALYLALGVVSALFEARNSGTGQVVDAAIVDGTASLAALFYGYVQQRTWQSQRGSNSIDSGAPYYEVYACADGGYMAFAPIEHRFYNTAVERLGLDPATLPDRDDSTYWPELKQTIQQAFAAHDREHWTAVFADVDACVTPVLNFDEAVSDPHLSARGTFTRAHGVVTPSPAPRFSRTDAQSPRPASVVTPSNAAEALSDWLPPELLSHHLSAENIIGDNGRRIIHDRTTIR